MNNVLNPVRTLIKQSAARVITRLTSPQRWTSFSPFPGVDVHGLVFGRRFVRPYGVVAALTLRGDGTYAFALVPTEEVPPMRKESDVRRKVVLASRASYVPAAHAFEPSPVDPQFCVFCAEVPLEHERARIRAVVQETLGTLDVQCFFRDDTAELLDVKVRTPRVQQPILNPVPAVGDDGRVEPVKDPSYPTRLSEYRSLTAEERKALFLDEGGSK